jgi:hypothetical protein
VIVADFFHLLPFSVAAGLFLLNGSGCALHASRTQ